MANLSCWIYERIVFMHANQLMKSIYRIEFRNIFVFRQLLVPSYKNIFIEE